MSYSISKVLNITSVKVNCESVTSESVLNESVTMARTCSFVETCEVYCSVAPKNNVMKGAMFYHNYPWHGNLSWLDGSKLTIMATNLLGHGKGYSQMSL